MRKYVVYNAAGDILRWGTCQTRDVARQAVNPGENAGVVNTLQRGLDKEKSLKKENGSVKVGKDNVVEFVSK